MAMPKALKNNQVPMGNVLSLHELTPEEVAIVEGE
jgi:hypothetical protein